MPTYLPCIDSPGVLVSDAGEVWRVGKKDCRRLKQRSVRNNAQAVTLPDGKTRLVHRLVLETFVGPCPPGNEPRHLNDNVTDNRADNLAWTPKTKTESTRPDKPYEGFPLFAHRNGQWAKKIAGRLLYFGPWDDWKAAVYAYHRFQQKFIDREPEKDEKPHIMIGDLIDRFLKDRKSQVASGELTQRSYDDYEKTCDRIAALMGREKKIEQLTPDEFAKFRESLAKTRNLTTLSNEIGRVRVVFNYAGPRHLNWLDRPVVFGTGFKKPTRKSMRVKRASEQPRELSAAMIKATIDASVGQLPAMIMLGINCGLGNNDCALLTKHHLDLDSGWLTFPRPKTGVGRRAKLWPETITALQEAWKLRPKKRLPRELQTRWFVTKYRSTWSNEGSGCPISQSFRRALKAAGGHRKGLGFYTLRHTFQTVAETCGDFPAISMVMGHVDNSMSAVYRERIDDSRLEKVAETVKKWWDAAK